MKLKVTVDGKIYEVDVEVAPEPAPVLPTFVFQSAPASIPSAPPSAAGDGASAASSVDETKVCRSPVSGIVVKVIARPGQSIQPGDVLFVLEAMKMETEITAGIAGKIAEVNVKVRDSVKSGDVVLTWV